MNEIIKQYLAEIARRGGEVTSEKKAKAVRKNGALGGRPRKDGRPAGSKPLYEALELINASELPSDSKKQFRMWAHSSATIYHEDEAFLPRAEFAQLQKTLKIQKPRASKKGGK